VSGLQISGPSVLLGAITGLTYGVLAIGLILVYRQSRVINFAYGEIGAFGAALTGLAVVSWHLPYWAAFVLGIGLAAIVGAASEVLIIRRLRRAPLLISVIATLGLGQLLDQFSSILNGNVAAGSSFPQPAGLPKFSVGALLVTPAYSGMLILSPFVVGGLVLFLRRSRTGMAMRATASNAEASSLAGVPANLTMAFAWGIGGMLAAFVAILVMPTRGFTSGSFLGPELLLRALAIAVIARMASMPVALAAGVVLGVVEQVILNSYANSDVVSVILFAIILGGLLLQRGQGTRREDKDDWSTVQSSRPPRDRIEAQAIRRLGWTAGFGVLAVGIVLPILLPSTQVYTLVVIIAFSVIGLSVGIITSLGGQLSLGQVAIAGVAATVSYLVASHTQSFIASFLIAALAAGVLSLLIGLPALRIRGIMLAVTTLSFALAAQDWLLSQPWMLGTGVVPGIPAIGTLAANTPTKYYYFSFVLLVVLFLLARNIWRSGLGLRMKAVRDNDGAARAFGLSPVQIKLQAFFLAGLFAGLGGALLGHSLSFLPPSTFTLQGSLDVSAMAAVGGIGSVIGPLLGALYIVGVPQWIPLTSAATAATALGWLVLVVQYPGGFVQSFQPTREKLIAFMTRGSVRAAAPSAGADNLATLAAAVEAGSVKNNAAERAEVPAQVERTASRTARRPAGSAGQVAPGEPVLVASGLSRHYGGVVAVSHVDLEVRRGEILGLIGPNGAGKTTLFELLSGFTRAQTGSVIYNGRNISRLSPTKRARLGLGRSFQDASLFPTLTVEETVCVALERVHPTWLAAAILGLPGARRRRHAEAQQILAMMGLTGYRHTPIRDLSTGVRRITELACMVALRPEVLLLDEPAAGIAQRETEALAAVLRRLKADLDLTLVIVEHDIPLLMGLADRIVAMEAGKVLMVGTPEEVRSAPEVIRSYLGSDTVAIERSRGSAVIRPAEGQPIAVAGGDNGRQSL
jgi:ABC-type branched-subunit amino acid transport system ATPase component/ABC-type branched-subunit amino acid transport system permease subunit